MLVMSKFISRLTGHLIRQKMLNTPRRIYAYNYFVSLRMLSILPQLKIKSNQRLREINYGFISFALSLTDFTRHRCVKNAWIFVNYFNDWTLKGNNAIQVVMELKKEIKYVWVFFWVFCACPSAQRILYCGKFSYEFLLWQLNQCYVLSFCGSF